MDRRQTHQNKMATLVPRPYSSVLAIFVQVKGLNQGDFKNWWNRGTVTVRTWRLIILCRLRCFDTGCLCGEDEADVLHSYVSYFSQSSWQFVTDHQWVNDQISGGNRLLNLHQALARQFPSSSLEKFFSCKSKIGHLVSSVFIMKHLQETTRCSFEEALLR